MCSKLLVCLLNVTDEVPQIAASIAIDKDWRTVVSIDQKFVSKSMYNDLLTEDVYRICRS